MRILALLLGVLAAPTVVTAQGSPDSVAVRATSTSPPKSVTLARVLAIIPGVGHGYAGEGGRGLAVAGGMLGIVSVAGLLLAGSCVADALDGTDSGGCDDDSPAAIIGGLAAYGLWGWSIYDAGSAARRTNARAARGSLLMRVPLTIGVSRGARAPGRDARTLRVGLRFTVR